MRIVVALEEHMVIPQVLEAWSAPRVASEDPGSQSGEGVIGRRLADVGEQRVRDMDDRRGRAGAVADYAGVQNLAPADAVRLAPEVNLRKPRIRWRSAGGAVAHAGEARSR
jgi:uncharacterized protein